jgi:hypothetical protein
MYTLKNYPKQFNVRSAYSKHNKPNGTDHTTQLI